MTKTKKTKNGRKLSTLVATPTYELAFSRPVKGVKNETTRLSIKGFDALTGTVARIRLDGRAVATLRNLIAK